jgi:hypothetical protein
MTFTEAATYLQKFGPVSRCYPDGRHSLHGDHYRMGVTIMTFRQLIERAQKMKEKHG